MSFIRDRLKGSTSKEDPSLHENKEDESVRLSREDRSQYSLNSGRRANNSFSKGYAEEISEEPAQQMGRDSEDNYSPRTSIVAMMSDEGDDRENLNHKENQDRSLNQSHSTRSVSSNLHSIRPKLKKKSGSLLGKLIYSNRGDSSSENPNTTRPSGSGGGSGFPSISDFARDNFSSKYRGNQGYSNVKHKIRVPSRVVTGSDNISDVDPNDSYRRKESELGYEDHKDTSASHAPPTAFDLQMNLDDMQDIVKSPDAYKRPSLSSRHSSGDRKLKEKPKKLSTTSSGSQYQEKSSWKAPDSWDVKMENQTSNKFEWSGSSDSDSDSVSEEGTTDWNKESKHLALQGEGSHSKKLPLIEPDAFERSDNKLPILFGSREFESVDSSSQKGGNLIIRVFKEDNTFTTVLCPIETTTADLLKIVQKKFFLASTNNFQIYVQIANLVKVLEPFEKPIKIQMGLLKLSGYTDKDNINVMGREDLSFICRFVIQNIHLRNLTHEEEAMLSKDYVDVNISGLGLKTIPIIFHQHTYEIEKLNVADNPSIYIPLDFIQSSTNLNTVVFSNNGCSKFPINFLEARRLTSLDMGMNFLDELPSKINYLDNLTTLKLNSNQLYNLPKSFGKLKNLVHLNLATNYFKFFPEVISELTNLVDLNFSYNDIAYLPDSIGNLTNLIKLNLCTNKLSKSLPSSFKKLISLKRLDIRYNNISNVEALESLPKLEVVYASKNNISTFSDQMESLRLLHFDRNPITNFKFANLMPILTVLDLSKAKITSLPPELVRRINNIEKLVLDKNHIVTLPSEIGHLTKLTYLSIYDNNLQTLPSSIGQLSSLQYLDLHSNNLQSLPDEIWSLRSLTVLNASSNVLSAIPKPPISVVKRISSSANFRNYLANSMSTPSITPDQSRRPSVQVGLDSQSSPRNRENDDDDSSTSSISFPNSTITLADSLLVLALGDNRLTDDCFDSISLFHELKLLNLSYNDIVEIPEGTFRRLTKLTELYMSGNELATLPADDFEVLRSLKSLFLNNNKLVSLPAEVSKLQNLQHFDVGSNQLKYNISNWPYDWSWHWNRNLKYLNFSGNKRFEIKQSHVKNPETKEYFDSLLVLKDLKVLGLIDVTMTTTAVPDQNIDTRIRTTSSELANVGYGVSDWMGMREHVSVRDIFIQKFRGNENEMLFCSFDGKNGLSTCGHKVSYMAKNLLVPNFTNELNKLGPNDSVQDAIRRTFLSLNRDINGILAAKKSETFMPSNQTAQELSDLNVPTDTGLGCAITLIYIRDKTLYSANIGDVEALLSRNNGDYIQLTNKHDPTHRPEFDRIKAAGGFVSGDGQLDGVLSVSRGAGFFNYLPHTHSGPDISEVSLTNVDDMVVVATKVLWDHINYESAVDLLRQKKEDPMMAAQKLRDLALCYGATDKLAVVVLTFGEQGHKNFGSNSLFNNLRDIDSFALRKRRDRAQPGDSNLRRLEDEVEPPVGELALVFTDIKNSTLLWDSYPIPMRSAIKIHNSIMRRQLRIVGGYEVKTEGDAFMVTFSSPVSALLWCFNVQQQLLTADWPAEILETDTCCEVTDGQGHPIFRGLSVRMGIHWGTPVCEPDIVTGRMDYFGPMVNRAARINAIADGGQICVSSDFLDEIKALYKLHDSITSGKTTLSDAYQGNIRAGEIIERELNSLEDIGSTYVSLGEKKLKGLETPEVVTIIYPKKLEMRFEIFKKSFNRDDSVSSTRVGGTLPIEVIFGLRRLSLKLEDICSNLSGGGSDPHENKGIGKIVNRIQESFTERDFIDLLNHVTTRIENCVANLYIRQELGVINGTGGRINSKTFYPSYSVMKDVEKLFEELKKIQQLKSNLELQEA